MTQINQINQASRLLRFGGARDTPAAPPAPFDPVDLFFSVVFEARTGRSLDGSGTPANLPGDPVAVWHDRSTPARSGTQSSVSARPTYQLSQEKAVLRFAADDFLTVPVAAGEPGFGDAVTIAARLEAGTTAFQIVASIGSANAAGAWYLALDSSNRIGMGAVGSAFCVLSAAPLTSGPHTVIARKNGPFASLRVDGAEVGVVTPGTTFTPRTGPLVIGGAQGYSLFFNGDLHFLAAAPSSLSDNDCAQMETYLYAL